MLSFHKFGFLPIHAVFKVLFMFFTYPACVTVSVSLALPSVKTFCCKLNTKSTDRMQVAANTKIIRAVV